MPWSQLTPSTRVKQETSADHPQSASDEIEGMFPAPGGVDTEQKKMTNVYAIMPWRNLMISGLNPDINMAPGASQGALPLGFIQSLIDQNVSFLSKQCARYTASIWGKQT